MAQVDSLKVCYGSRTFTQLGNGPWRYIILLAQFRLTAGQAKWDQFGGAMQKVHLHESRVIMKNSMLVSAF